MSIKRLLAAIAIVHALAVSVAAESKDLSEIKIGASLALTGKIAFIGNSARAALELAVEDINSTGGVNGHPLKLIVDDNQGDAKIAVTATQKFISLDKVDILFTSGTHIATALAPIADKAGVPTIYHASSNIPAQTFPHLFKDYGDAEAVGTFLAKKVAAANLHKLAILSEISDVCTLTIDRFKKDLSGTDQKIVTELTYNTGDADFRSLLTKMKPLNPDGIVMCIWRDTNSVMKQLKELGMNKIPSFHFHSAFLPTADDNTTRKIFEESKAVSSWYGFTIGDVTPKQQELIARVLKKTGEARALVPDIAMAYDDMMLLKLALQPCTTVEGVDRACVTDRLSAVSYEGLAGKLSFGKERLSVRPVFGIVVKNGEWVRE